MFKVRFIVYGNKFEVERTVLMPNPINLRVMFGVIDGATDAYIHVKEAEWDVSEQMFTVHQRSSFLKKVWEEVGFRDVRS